MRLGDLDAVEKTIRARLNTSRLVNDPSTTRAFSLCLNDIQRTPTVSKKEAGEWEIEGTDGSSNIYRCPVCRSLYYANRLAVEKYLIKEQPAFCPECGRKLRAASAKAMPA